MCYCDTLLPKRWLLLWRKDPSMSYMSRRLLFLLQRSLLQMQSFFNFGQWKVCNPMLTIKNWVPRDCLWQRNASKCHFKSMQVERHFMQQLHTGEWKFSLQPMYFHEPNAGLTLNKKMLIHLSTGRSESRSKRRSYMPSLPSQLHRMLVQLDLH
jgi:hypothetical protein